MPRVVSIEKRARGVVQATTDDGSLFIFKACFLPEAADGSALLRAFLAGGGEAVGLPVSIGLEALELAAGATAAEAAAVALLARAEQFRRGLEGKLGTRGYGRAAVAAALDGLEASSLLSDERYAGAWIRQRLRRRLDGPLSLSAALSGKGVDAGAAARALKETLGGPGSPERLEAIGRQLEALLREGLGAREARSRLAALGWKRAEIDECLDALEIP